MQIMDRLGDLLRPCAFVPTMGALHAGHQSLITLARQYCDDVVVSVFINPLQFEKSEDLDKYPKTPELDARCASEAGATILWRPSYDEIYPGELQKISAGECGNLFEGASRPGHFDGVLTVVHRLFELVQPKYAIFGEKDFQQLFLIKAMSSQLHPEIEIISAPTVREESGLAMSSRNIRLSQNGKKVATALSRVLSSAADTEDLVRMKSELSLLARIDGFTLDYAEIIDEETFQIANEETSRKRAIVAGWVDGVRLIDNMAMKPALVRL